MEAATVMATATETGTAMPPPTTTYSTTRQQVRVLNYDFKLPLVVMLGSFEVEPSWRYSIPVNKLEGDPSRSRSFYTLNLTYSF